MDTGSPRELFRSARWYDQGINWEARFARELPVLQEVFGVPGGNGLLDAGCGTGRHLVEMSRLGYRMTGLDFSPEMLRVAREHLEAEEVEADLVEASFEEMDSGLGPFDGVLCLANALAAAGSAEKIRGALRAFSGALISGGRLFVQVLNFEALRKEPERARGPRVRVDGDMEYVSTRIYTFVGDEVDVTNVTHYRDDEWKQFVHRGRLCAVTGDQLCEWCDQFGLKIDAMYGGYDRVPFDVDKPGDLILVATKR